MGTSYKKLVKAVKKSHKESDNARDIADYESGSPLSKSR